MSNALGVHACQSGYRTRYVRLLDLFSEIEVARIQGKYKELMKQYQKYALMILDKFLLLPTSESEQRDLLELMEVRCGKSSTILCSQFIPEGWHDRLGGSALADSILDRIIPSAYTMIIDGDVSMRKRKRLIQD
ncbi:ATP-binding protein [Proteiniclasticum sediminis]|uniref:ATP-binding protein n=1 Tax=Proteiniclasticum sediminis TaxID=2804028 RepID=UPI002ED84C7C